MLNTKPNAFNKIGILVRTSLQKIENLNKPRIKFMYSLFELWLILPVRYTMLNLSRFGNYSDKSIRLHFEKKFDFAAFNSHVINTLFAVAGVLCGSFAALHHLQQHTLS